MKSFWFIDQDFAIRQVFLDSDGILCPSQQYDKLEIEDKLLSVLVWDADELVLDYQFTLYETLTSLAKAIED